MDILHNAEKLGGPNQLGGWQKKMARQRYQGGTVRKRGKRNPVWELQWREDYIKKDRTIGRRLVTVKLGTVQELTRRQAKKLANEKLRLLNQGQWAPSSTMTLQDFVDGYLVPNLFPTLKASTQDRYRRTLNTHLLPAFGKYRLCDLGILDVQRFVLQKMEAGLGWESANHYRNLLSKIFVVAKKWGYFSGPNPVAGGRTSRENSGTRKACPHARANNEANGCALRTRSHNGSVVFTNRIARGGSSGIALEKRRFCFRGDSHYTSLLSRDHRLPKNQMQQTSGFDTECSQSSIAKAARECKARGRGIGVPHIQRNTTQRFQLAPSFSETSRQETRNALAQLAYFAANSHHAIPGGGRIIARCASAAGTFEDVHYPRNLHSADPRTAADHGRKTFGFDGK